MAKEKKPVETIDKIIYGITGLLILLLLVGYVILPLGIMYFDK